MPHPFRRNEVIHAFWRGVGFRRPPTPSDGSVPCSFYGCVRGFWPLRQRRQRRALGDSRRWGSSSDEVDGHHAKASSNQRVSTPWISSSSPPPSPPDSRIPTTPPVSLPPGILAPPASDFGGTLTGFRPVDCPVRLRVDDAFSCLREDDEGWVDGGRSQLSCSDRLPWSPTCTPPASRLQRFLKKSPRRSHEKALGSD